jgi:hypothetical protein
MTTKLEVWVESSASWRGLKLNAAGEPVYESNGSKVGQGMRITRVVDVPIPPPPPPVNHPPVAGDISFVGTING